MKWIKRILVILFIIFAILALISWVFFNSMKPDYNEQSNLPGLESQVQVYYDQYAVPHIYAESKADAYRTLGYVYAKERLWQMEITKRIGPGRLSEIFGKVTVETDKFFRSLGIQQYSKSSSDHFIKEGDSEIKGLVNAYLDGINAFVENGTTPIEFRIMGIKKTPFTLDDVYNVAGYMAFSFAMAHKTEPIVSYISDKYGIEYLNDLDIHVDTQTVMIRSYLKDVDFADLSLVTDKIMQNIAAPPFIGSNSWVIGPGKTETGQVILANDPHIGFSQPAVWYEAHLEAPGLSLYGNYLGGYPFPQIGHSDHHAIGLTMFENDDIDLFKEKVNSEHPEQYWHNNEWKKFDIREEVIHVKGENDIKIDVKTTVHGPVISPFTKGLDHMETISMWWVYFQFPNEIIPASYQIMNATSMEEARMGASKFHAPGLNIMYGDVDGNIAWWAAAKLPIRPKHVNSKLILDGTGKDDPLGFYEFTENPQAENPPWGYVYSANNQSLHSPNKIQPGYYLSEDRARRISNLLKDKNDWSVEDVQKMMLDVTSENAPEIVASMKDNIEYQSLSTLAKECMDVLIKWDGKFEKSSTAAVIYIKVLYQIFELGMKDELGEYFDLFIETHLMKRSLQPLFANETSIWWDDQYTSEIESGKVIFQKGFEKAVTELVAQHGEDIQSWKWSHVHTLEHGHSLGANETLRPYFNVGPFEVDGSTEVINNLQYRLNGEGIYKTFAGPSCRRIVDFSNIRKNSWSILPTGQSGNPLSPHYSDQAEMFVRGEFRKKMMDENEIKSSFKYLSTFKPKK